MVFLLKVLCSLLSVHSAAFLTKSFGRSNKFASLSLSCLILEIISACRIRLTLLGSCVQHSAFSMRVSVGSMDSLNLSVSFRVLDQISLMYGQSKYLCFSVSMLPHLRQVELSTSLYLCKRSLE